MNLKRQYKQSNSIANFIENLLNSPPKLNNPLKKSTSHKNLNDSLTFSKDLGHAEPIIRLTPMKKSRSEDKASQIFNTSKNYIEQISPENSMIMSHISQLTESGNIGISGYSGKTVKFRQNLISRNAHYRKEFARKESKTPSILKRSQLIRNSTLQFIQNNSINSHIHGNSAKPQPSNISDDRELRASKTNEVVKKRYFTIIERFQTKFANKMKKKIKLRSQQKYKDQLFPPILSSILRGGSRNQEARSYKFKWIRISDLYKDRQLVVATRNGRSNITIGCQHGCNNFIGDAFTCIKNSHLVLEKMFQSLEINEFGVYLVKIFQQNVWKYIVVDDFIPIVETATGGLEPYFLHCQQIDENGRLEIWPYLVEKAYANYYANYESLHFGNALDFLEEITGIAGQIFHFLPNEKKQRQNSLRLQKLVSIEDSTLLGFVQSQGSYLPIEKNEQGLLIAYNPRGSSQLTINLEHIYQYFDKIYVFNPRQWIFSSVSTIGINIKKLNDVQRFDISLRTVRIQQPGLLSISIRQKEKRFYQRSSLNYDYIWIRVFLLQKQLAGDCRWIDGRYSNAKSIHFLSKVEAGEYYIIVLPEWKSSHCYELSLIINSNIALSLNKKQYNDREGLVQKGCSDLAQRFGKLHQINLFACNYSFIYEQMGILIENINNERYNGDIKINRSINGLKAAVDLVPFNIEFYLQRNNKMPFKTQISVYIRADQSYTVVLMMRGGIDLPFLKKFDFGK